VSPHAFGSVAVSKAFKANSSAALTYNQPYNSARCYLPYRSDHIFFHIVKLDTSLRLKKLVVCCFTQRLIRPPARSPTHLLDLVPSPPI
jgi:hypothetical protein